MNNKKKPSTAEKIGRIALGTGKIAISELIEKATKEINAGKEKVRVSYPVRPENESRVKFVKKVRPAKTYVNANRNVSIWESFSNKKENIGKHSIPFIEPSNDGLVSFSLLLAPVAFLLGLIYALNIYRNQFGLFFLLLIYILFVAIPGSYLGLSAVIATGKTAIYGGKETLRFFVEVIHVFIRGLWELIFLAVTNIWTFIFRYWAFSLTYLISCSILFFGVNAVWSDIEVNNILSFSFIFLILLPALFPASIAHRQWVIHDYKKKYKSKSE